MTKLLVPVLALIWLWAPLYSQQSQFTKVRTTAPTELRTEASADGPVLEDVDANVFFDLVGEEGDWFRVRLPGDPRLGGVRVEAYLSKAAAALATEAEAAAAAAEALQPPPPGEGVNVGLDLPGGRTVWLSAVAVRPVAVAGSLESVVAAAASDAVAAAIQSTAPPPPESADEVTWVWATGAADDVPAVVERRPSFFVSYTNVRGLTASNFVPQVVRLMPVGSSAYVVSVATGRADARVRVQPDWLLSRVLEQDELRIDLEGSAGLLMVRLRSFLPPGRYAVVLRPATTRPYAGAQVLSWEGPGLAFSAAWPFVIN